MKKTKLLIICVLLALSHTWISAQTKSSFTGSLLWKISGNNLKSPSYILGTHHFVDNDLLNKIAGLENAIKETSQIVGEIVLSDMEIIQGEMQSQAIVGETETYDILLSSEQYEQLDNNLIALMGVGLSKLGHYKPGMISTLMTMRVYAMANPQFNLQEHQAIDIVLQEQAIASGKPVIGLETTEDQINALFYALPQGEQAENLICQTSTQSIEYGVELYKLLNKYYYSGDIELMYEISVNNEEDPCPTSEEEINTIAYNRNHRWMEKLPQIMSDNSSIIAVGALHLAGEQGLLYQLNKLGYMVEAVR